MTGSTATATPAPDVAVSETDRPVPEENSQVLVRMYGQGLGDCFLLSFPRAASDAGPTRPVYVLIDCGVLSGTPDSSRRMQQIVEDIRRTTRDDSLKKGADGEAKGHLDLLVVTHEHWDHLSGFIYADARKAWKEIQVDTVWTGWTAKHEPNGLAGVLQEIKNLQAQALVELEEQAMRFGLDDQLGTVLGLNRFLMDKDEKPDRTLASGLKFVIEELGGNNCVYCEPGDVRPVPGSESVAYVLGPPRNWDRLSRMNPSSAAPETYENPFALRLDPPADAEDPAKAEAPVDADLAQREQLRALRRMLADRSTLNAFVTSLQCRMASGLATAAGGIGTEEPTDIYYRSLPFDRSFRIPLDIAEAEAANAPATYPALASYFDSVNHWRRIDRDWLLAANAFALAADNFVNNTSLVLAFELPAAAGAERRVLLFVADAQVGNWLSWDDIPAWTIHDGATPAQAGAKPNIGDLLKRTVLYKVGHHGSHNATLKEKGAERMRADGTLTAFVPVSEAVAHNVGWSEMPLRALLESLTGRTGGRVVLPGGVWSALDEAGQLQAHETIGLKVSSQMLGAKVSGDGDELEGPVPLWVEIAIGHGGETGGRSGASAGGETT